MNRENEIKAFVRLLDVMDELRERCPWDRKQTMESLRPLTIEETYELSDSIMEGDYKSVSKELGDLMLHMVFYAKIGKEKGLFDIADVMNLICDKLIFRHPHVFGDVEVSGAGEVIQNWEQLKRREKDGNKTILSGVPSSLPSLVKAYRVQDKVRAVGFDWSQRSDVWSKVREEIAEFEAEARVEDGQDGLKNDRMEREFGDLLFSLVNAARLYDINPDTALERTNMKFIRRFGYLEKWAAENGRSIKEMSLEEMDRVWEESKSIVG
ncbi:MAG: nucleoside triphosphate pyrophosphohydrolase [Bacteroidetes bacterium 41-46]|nr:MAG: nucleoside triphosphate pyrophosphohydrolase [Bacteroidetes bacterium 41-46]